MRFLDGVDKGDALLVVAEIRKLSEHGVRKGFCRDGGAVAYDEYGAPLRIFFSHAGSSCKKEIAQRAHCTRTVDVSQGIGQTMDFESVP